MFYTKLEGSECNDRKLKGSYMQFSHITKSLHLSNSSFELRSRGV